jgi:hypothetical protein
LQDAASLALSPSFAPISHEYVSVHAKWNQSIFCYLYGMMIMLRLSVVTPGCQALPHFLYVSRKC